MKKVKYRFNIILLIGILIFTTLFIIRFRYINNKYPQPITEEYNLNEIVNCGGCEIVVQECQWLSDKEIRDLDIGKDNLSDEETKAILVKVKVKNTSNEEKNIEAYLFEAESLDWHNGLNLGIATAINGENSSLNLNLAPNEEVTRILAYSMVSPQYNSDEWAHVKEREFKLVMSLYPVKKEVILKFD